MALIKKCTETSLMSLVVIKRPRFGAGGIIDQGVIHYDTWLRRHSQPVCIHSSMHSLVLQQVLLKYSTLENKSSLSPQAFTRTSIKKKDIKNP